MTHPGSRLPDVSTLFPWRAWARDPMLRSWTTWLFVALVAVPPLALTLIPSDSYDIGATATAFAFYFAAAWFLVLWVVVRPQNVRGALLAQLVALALVLETPLAAGLEEALDADTDNLLLSIVTVGVPEELAKMLPVAVLALVHRRLALAPRDFLFLGAVSGLAFGAVEAVVYATGYTSQSVGLEGALVLVWRFVTDPVAHACWAGVAGYFVGLASRFREPRHWAALGGLGLGVPAVLHGLNDWTAGSGFWVLVCAFSALLFLAYARIGIVGRPQTGSRRPFTSAPSAPVAYLADPPTAPIMLPNRAAEAPAPAR